MTEVVGARNNSNHDMLSELLIAKLLEDDMRAMEDTRTAEALQLNEALTTSALATGHFPKKARTDVLGHTDHEDALDVFAAEIAANRDALVAQALQQAEDSNMTASLQYAQKLAAAEKKSLLDSMFAQRLQQAIDDGDDDEAMQDAESVLGMEAIEHIMVGDMNDKGKGKVPAPFNGKDPISPGALSVKMEEDTFVGLYTTCGICMEPFQATHSPVAASRSANCSSRLQFGIYLPCSLPHGYCISCLNGYLLSKLDPDGNGYGNQNVVVFPIRCPECPVTEWPEGIPDSIAERVLSEKGMLLWHHQKLLDSLPRYYCPNPRCSALVQMDEDSDDPQASCPSCSELICVPCQVVWHADMTCEEYQALPLDERSPEDQKALQLMRAQNWRRCPKCAIIVELTVGCNHITCRCKTEFCFKCGGLWNVQQDRCYQTCELWDEEMLLEERERRREQQRQRLPQAGLPARQGVARAPAVAAPAPPPPYEPRARIVVAAPPRFEEYDDYNDDDDDDDEEDSGVNNGARPRDEFAWMNDPNALSTRHCFTANMIKTLTCLYCDVKLTSTADLRYHLSHVRWHGVYACCGRFFKRDVDLDRHIDSKYGSHAHTIRRNV